MNVKACREFANGRVYALQTTDGWPIEVTDTFLPFYTKDAIGQHQNALSTADFGSRKERWMVGVSTMSGCPVGCKFCATGKLKRWRNLTYNEIIEQVNFVLRQNEPAGDFWWHAKEFKINYTRMGEPFLNIDNVREAIKIIDIITGHKVHHYVSTIGIRGSDFSWVKDNVSLQISLHSLDEQRRKELIPVNNLMTLEELGQIRTESKLKTTINLTLVDEADFDIEKLKRYFDPKYFFIKLSPINVNAVSEANGLGEGVIKARNIA